MALQPQTTAPRYDFAAANGAARHGRPWFPARTVGASPCVCTAATRAEALAQALAGRRVGRDWAACCPAHDDREPSLSICCAEDGKVLVRCHAGCAQDEVIATLRSRGLWPEVRSPRPPILRDRRQADET